MFLRNANPGAAESELLARDKLAHALMYFSRGNPVLYYGDEQGFTGAGGDQDARQDMFPSQSPQYNNLSDPVDGDDGAGKNDNIGSDETPMDDNFDQGHELYRELAGLAAVTAATRRCATAPSSTGTRPRRPASTRSRASTARASTSTSSRSTTPSSRPRRPCRRSCRTASGRRSGAAASSGCARATTRRSTSRSPRCRRSCTAPRSTSRAAGGRRGRRRVPTPSADRTGVVADIGGDSFYEVTFLAKAGNGAWRDIGTDDNAPYRVFHDTSDIEPGTQVSYKAIVLDNAGHTSTSAVEDRDDPRAGDHHRGADQGQRVRGSVEVRAIVTPEHADYSMRFERSVDGGAVHDGRHRRLLAGLHGDRQPVGAARRGEGHLPRGARLRARQDVTSATRSVTVVQARVTDGDGPLPAHVGRELRGVGAAHVRHRDRSRRGTPAWTNAKPFEGIDADGGVNHKIDIADDTKRVGIIVHGRPPGGNPNIKDTDPTTGTSSRSRRRRSGSRRATGGSSTARGGWTAASCRRRAEGVTGCGPRRSSSAPPRCSPWRRPAWADHTPAPGTVALVGSLQSELGCPGDWQPECAATRLQPVAGSRRPVPGRRSTCRPGNYEYKVALNNSWDENYGAGGAPGGANIPLTAPGGPVTFTYDHHTHVISDDVPRSLQAERGAHWLRTGVIAWRPPAGAQTFRLHSAPEGGLAVAGGAITGGSSVPLELDAAGLPADVRAQFPHLASWSSLRLSSAAQALAPELLKGELVVAAYDGAGALLGSTGVQVPGVLDDLYADAARAELGPVWSGRKRDRRPSLAVWAPTAKDVALLIDPAGPAPSGGSRCAAATTACGA